MGYIFDDWKDLLDEFQKCGSSADQRGTVQ